jgi:hypothetical protein
MAPLRDEGSVLAATVNSIDASPWPSGGLESLSQSASLLTDHVHSRFVDMRTVADPPVGGNVVVPACPCTAHRTGKGAVTVCEEDPQDVERRALPDTIAHTVVARSQ